MDRLDIEHLAILTLSGDLTDARRSGEFSCLIHSFSAIDKESLEEIGVEIQAALSSGSPEELEQRGKKPFETICQILERHGVQVVDVASISVDQEGDVWTQVGDVNFHANKLRLISLKQE